MVALDIRTPPTLRVDTFDHRKSQGYNSLTTDVVVEPKVEIREVDLKNQVENLKLLIASVEADIGRKEENKLTAQTTEAWLLTLRERIEEVEEDTGEALEKRRKLVKLLVEQIKVDRNEDGHTQVQITYRFGPPPEEPGVVYGVQNSPLWYNARR